MGNWWSSYYVNGGQGDSPKVVENQSPKVVENQSPKTTNIPPSKEPVRLIQLYLDN